jgi:hypothetical protein
VVGAALAGAPLVGGVVLARVVPDAGSEVADATGVVLVAGGALVALVAAAETDAELVAVATIAAPLRSSSSLHDAASTPVAMTTAATAVRSAGIAA